MTISDASSLTLDSSLTIISPNEFSETSFSFFLRLGFLHRLSLRLSVWRLAFSPYYQIMLPIRQTIFPTYRPSLGSHTNLRLVSIPSRNSTNIFDFDFIEMFPKRIFFCTTVPFLGYEFPFCHGDSDGMKCEKLKK